MGGRFSCIDSLPYLTTRCWICIDEQRYYRVTPPTTPPVGRSPGRSGWQLSRPTSEGRVRRDPCRETRGRHRCPYSGYDPRRADRRNDAVYFDAERSVQRRRRGEASDVVIQGAFGDVRAYTIYVWLPVQRLAEWAGLEVPSGIREPGKPSPLANRTKRMTSRSARQRGVRTTIPIRTARCRVHGSDRPCERTGG
ncbi:hypothetical protein SAMN04487967_0481 [Natronorubrum sediminis]|uniref:Uncharacterized protein n=1 Tax=Natronorubrum sediminis TaxID=640943 RepID=A0A1H6FNK8_9EURY|nr:hypothetical protein SAMN04487967_0481 [Natronorubrum sediminis]